MPQQLGFMSKLTIMNESCNFGKTNECFFGGMIFRILKLSCQGYHFANYRSIGVKMMNFATFSTSLCIILVLFPYLCVSTTKRQKKSLSNTKRTYIDTSV